MANRDENSDGMNKTIDDFVKLVSHVKEGGDFVLAACRVGPHNPRDSWTRLFRGQVYSD